MKALSRLLIILLGLLPLRVHALVNWHTLHNNNFKVFYQTGMENEAMSAIQTLEYYRPYVEKLTGNSHPQTAIKIEDIGNLVNGYANPVGNQIALFRYPPTSDELSYCDDWTQMVATHEYIHMLQMTNDSGVPRLLRMLFGNLLYVQLHQPMWMTEGITVYGESQLSPTAGRMNSGYYSSIISALAKEDRLPSMTKASYYSTDTPLAHYYVFGGSFHSYLSRSYGEDKLALLYDDNSSRVESYANGVTPGLSLNVAFARVYGKSLENLWQDWQNSEKSKPYSMPQQRISFSGWNKSDLKSYDGMLYFIGSKTDKTGPSASFGHNGIVRMDPGTGAYSYIIRQSTDFPAGYQIANKRIYYTRNQTKRGFGNNENDGYGYITEILSADLMGNDNRLLCSGLYRAFCALPDGTLLLAEDSPDYHSSTIKSFNPTTGIVNELMTSSKLVHGIFSNNGRIFLNARDYWKNSSIFELNLDAKTITPIIDTPFLETITAVNDGMITFQAVYDGNMGSYQYNLATGKCSRYVGYSDVRFPVEGPESRNIFLSINGDGMDIYSDALTLQSFNIPQKAYASAPYQRLSYHQVTPPVQQTLKLKADTASSPSTWDEAMSTYNLHQGTYAENIKHLLLPRMLRLPILEGTSDSLSIGAMLVGNDLVGDFPQWQLSGVYDSKLRKTDVDFAIQNSFFRPLHQQFQITTADGGGFAISNYSTLFRRENYGLNSVSAGFSYQADDAYERRIISPFISSSASWAGGQLGINNSVYWEDEDKLSSNRDRLGWQGQLSVRQQTTAHSELRSTINLAYDPDADYDDVFYPLRGYKDELPANEGLSIRNTWYHPIYKIREGMWSPQIYLEDISAGLFYDAAFPRLNSDRDYQSSYGLELIAEVGAAFYGMANVGVRAGYDRAGESFIEMILGTNF